MVGVRVPEPGTALRQFVYHQTLLPIASRGEGINARMLWKIWFRLQLFMAFLFMYPLF